MSGLFSVIICTYNRAKLLKDVLSSLCEQSIEKSLFEIIVVDNNSTDNTRLVVESNNFPNSIRYCFEPKQGLSYARNTGWRFAQSDYVVYFDDDCRVPKHWLEVAKQVTEDIAPEVFGGPTFPFYDGHKPSWFRDAYHTRTYGDRAKVLQEQYLTGTNIAFRRNLFEILGGFRTDLGMSGEKIAYGEEIVLQQQVRSILPNAKIYYEPKLYVRDLVRPEKMEMRWIMKERLAAGRYSCYTFPEEVESAYLRLVSAAFFRGFAFFSSSMWALFFRNRASYPYIQNYLIEKSFKHLNALGRTSGQIANYSSSIRVIPIGSMDNQKE